MNLTEIDKAFFTGLFLGASMVAIFVVIGTLIF